MGVQRLHLKETPSTNTVALEWLRQKPPEGALVWASRQTAGRGQTGSSWIAEPGQNFTGSYILYPGFLAPDRLHLVTHIAAIAVLRFLQSEIFGQDIRIKWPNDVWVGGRKICGILTENVWNGDQLVGMVCGIGLNLNTLQFPPELQDRAVSLAQLSGKQYRIEDCIQELSRHLEICWLQLRSGRNEGLQSTYLQHLYRYQETGWYDRGQGAEQATLVGVTPEGKLALDFGNGKLSTFGIKEIQFL